MRSLVITAIIILFCALTSIITNIAPMIMGDAMPADGLNQSTVTTMTDNGQIANSQSGGLNTYYGSQVSITSILINIVTGTIYIGGRLQAMGMDALTANFINLLLAILVAFDQITFWGKIPW